MPTQYGEPENKDKGDKMVLKSIYFEPQEWQQAMSLADKRMIPLSRIIRKLVQLWLQGKINLDNFED